MAARKPLVIVGGLFSELPVGDSTVELAAAPSGIIYVGTKLGIDGSAQISGNAGISAAVTAQASGNAALIVSSTALASGNFAQSTGTTALASGNAAQSTANTALVSGNAALSRAGGTMTGPIVFAAGQQITTAVNLSGSISGAIPYQSAPSATTFLSPGVSGQVLATQGNNQIPRWITPGGGKILQAVQGTLTGNFSSSSTSFVDTGLTVNITLSSASSRVLLLASCNNLESGQQVFVTIYRNGVNIVGGDSYLSYSYNGGTSANFPTTSSRIDSPSTTSAITYTVYARTNYGTFYFNRSSGGGSAEASLTALEIGP